MNLTINGKEYELKFGLDFINHLDKKYFIEQNGLKIGQGLISVIAQIEIGNPAILLDLITAATLKGKPKVEEIKKFIENEADIEGLMVSFLSELEKSPMTRFTLKKLDLLSK